MASFEQEEWSAPLSAQSSEQSSLGLIKLDSVAGLSGLLEEDGDGGMDPRYFYRVSHEGGRSDSLTLDGAAIEETVSEDVRLLSSVRTAEEADISGRHISARSTSIGALGSLGSRASSRDDTGAGFGSGCFDGMEDFQKEFDAGDFIDGGESFKAQLDQAEQSLDTNGLPLVNFSLSSGTYDPHAKVRPSGYDESVNISEFLKAGSYPMGVLGDASTVEPPPRFSMSAVQSGQATNERFPEEDWESTASSEPRSRETFSVSRGSGYSQIHGSGGVGGPGRVGTYTVLTAADAAPSGQMGDDATAGPATVTGTASTASTGRGGVDGSVAHLKGDALPGAQGEVGTQPPETSGLTEGNRRTASVEQRYSREVVRAASIEGGRDLKNASGTTSLKRSASYGNSKIAGRSGRGSQDSQEASLTLVNASRPSQDSQDSDDLLDSQDGTLTGTLTPDRSREVATPVSVRPLRRSAALGDSLRRKIVDVLNRTEEARLQLLVPGRQSPTLATKGKTVTGGREPTASEIRPLSEQPIEEPSDGGQHSVASTPVVHVTSPTPKSASVARTAAHVSAAEGDVSGWTDASLVFSGDAGALNGSEGSGWPQVYPRSRADDLRRRQEREMAEHKQRQEERIQAARAQQAALRQQWEVEQDHKDRAAGQARLQKKRDAKARRDSAVTAEKSGNDTELINDENTPPQSTKRPSHGLITATSSKDIPIKASTAAPAVLSTPVPPYPAATPEHEAVSRVLQELNVASASVPSPTPLSVQQVVEAVMKQLAMPDVSLDESCRSRAELNVTEVLQELRGEGEQLVSQIEQWQTRPAVAASGEGVEDRGDKPAAKDVVRMAETVSRLHRGLPARPRGEQPHPSSPVRRRAVNPVQQPSSQRGVDGGRAAAARRRPSSACADRATGEQDRRGNSAQAELAVRGRRVPRMGVRRQVEELTSEDSDRGRARRIGSPGKPARKSPARRSAAAASAVSAAAKMVAVSTCPDSASSDGSARTYSIASDRAPGSLPAIVTEMEQEQLLTKAPAAPALPTVPFVVPAAPSAAPVAPSTAPTAPVPPTGRAANASTANPDFERASTDYESPEFLVAQAARRYPSSTPSLARSVAEFAARKSLDHVSPIVPDDSSEHGGEMNGDANAKKNVNSGAETGCEMSSGTGGDLKTDVPEAGEVSCVAAAGAEPAASVDVLVPPPAVWPSEESSVGLPAVELRQPAGTSTGSVATTAVSAARPSSGAACLPAVASLQSKQQVKQQQQVQQAPQQTQPQLQQQNQVVGSSSAETAGGAAKPRRSRIPTPVRRHVSDLAASCQSAPCLLQRGPAAPPRPLVSAVPAAGRRPGGGRGGADRRAGPLAVTRSNSAASAVTRDAAAQTGPPGGDAAGTARQLRRSASVQSHTARQAETGRKAGTAKLTETVKQARNAKQPLVRLSSVDQTQGRGQDGMVTAKTTSHVSAQAQTSESSTTVATGEVPPVEDKRQTEDTASRNRTPSVSLGVQTSDVTFTVSGDGQAQGGRPGATEKVPPAVVSAGAQTETGQWTGRDAEERRGQTVAASDLLDHGDSALDRPVLSNGQGRVTNGEQGRGGMEHQTAQTVQTGEPLSAETGDTAAVPDMTTADTTTDGRSLVDAPENISHPDILCTDIPTDICIPVTNRTEHWIQLVPNVASLTLNGSPMPVKEAPNIITVSLRTRTLLDRHQEAAVRVTITPRTAGRITVTLSVSVEPIERRLAGGSLCVELRVAAERPAVEVLSQEPGLLEFGTLPEDCRKAVPLTLVNLSRAAVPVTLAVLSSGRAFYLPDGDAAETAPCSAAAPARLAATEAQLTLPAADASRQGISPVSVSVALLTPCLEPEKDWPSPKPLLGRLEVRLAGACPPPPEPLLSCRLQAAVGRVKLRTRTREPLELRCRPAQTASANLPIRNAGNIPLELRLSVAGLRDSVWVRPEHVTVPPAGERDVMVTFQPRAADSAGRGLLVLTVQPDGMAYEVDIIGVIGDCRAAERQRPCSPEMKSARRHGRSGRQTPSPTRARSQSHGRRAHDRSHSRSVSPSPPGTCGGGRDAEVVSEVRDTAVQTSLLTLVPPSAPAPAQPSFRQPAEPPPRPEPSAAAPSLHSNRTLLLWAAARCGQPAVRSLTLRNSSETEPLALRMAVSGNQFTFGAFAEDSAAEGSTTAELRLAPRSEREVPLVYRPSRVETVSAALVIKPVMRPRNGVGKKFTIPLVAYSGSPEVQLSVSPETGLRLGELRPGVAVRASVTVTNTGNRRAFVKVLGYRDAECRHKLSAAEFSARGGGRLSLSAGEARDVALVLRATAGRPPPAAVRVISGDDLLRQAFHQRSQEGPLSFRAVSPGLMTVDFGGDFEGEREADPAELSALKTLPDLADTFYSLLRQTRLPVRATISSHQMDSSDVFNLLHADDTMASILNNTSVANVTREPRRPAAAPAPTLPRRQVPAQWTESDPAQDRLNTSQRPARTAPPSTSLPPPPVAEFPAESGPLTAAPPPPAPLLPVSDQLLFPTTAAGQRSAASLQFTNASAAELSWTLETLVKPWVQSTPRAADHAQVAGEVFRFHPTQGGARPGQTVSLAARFSPPAAGYFTQTVYLISRAAAADTLEGKELVQPCCLPVRVAGQAAPPAVTEPEPFPLLVEPDTIQFPAEQPRVVKLKINNKTRLDYEFELHVSGPFSVNHERMLSRARRYIHLPVIFKPPGPGLFTGQLTLSLPQPTGMEPQSCFHVTLIGEVP